MRIRALLVGCALIVLGIPETALSQLCNGTAPIDSNRPFQVGASASFSDDVTSTGGGFVAGSPGFFGSVFVGRASFDDFNKSALEIAGSGGLQMPLGTRGWMLCPIVNLSSVFGPNDVGTPPVDANILSIGGGAAVGFVAIEGDGFEIVPSASLGISRRRTKIEFASDSQSEINTFGIAALRVGLVMNRRVSIVPSISFPFDGDGVDTYVGVGITFSLNR